MNWQTAPTPATAALLDRATQLHHIDAQLHKHAAAHRAYLAGQDVTGCPLQRLRTIDALLDERLKVTGGGTA